MKKLIHIPKHHYQKEKTPRSKNSLVSEFVLKILVLPAVFAPTLALAQSELDAAQSAISQIDPTKGSGAATGDLTGLLNSILNRIPYFLGGLALLALLYSGFIYVTAFGDAAKMEAAKKNMTWTMIGIIAVAAIYAIIEIAVQITAPRLL
jgi:uncharacterized membrane protein YhaH (DUF805 family)